MRKKHAHKKPIWRIHSVATNTRTFSSGFDFGSGSSSSSPNKSPLLLGSAGGGGASEVCFGLGSGSLGSRVGGSLSV